MDTTPIANKTYSAEQLKTAESYLKLNCLLLIKNYYSNKQVAESANKATKNVLIGEQSFDVLLLNLLSKFERLSKEPTNVNPSSLQPKFQGCDGDRIKELQSSHKGLLIALFHNSKHQQQASYLCRKFMHNWSLKCTVDLQIENTCFISTIGLIKKTSLLIATIQLVR